MITRKLVPAQTKFVAGDGSEHSTLAEAQRADLIVLLSDELAESIGDNGSFSPSQIPLIADALLRQSKHVIDTLTTGPKSIVKARACNGGKKVRAKRHEAPQLSLPAVNGESQVTAA
jgi:hypothetical protein